jgi:hypothetical protein
LERSNERERNKALKIRELEKRCRQLVLQITGLISQQQGSEAENSSLRAEIDRLIDVIDVLSTNALPSLD